MAKLSKSEMAALDLLIAKKQEEAGFINDIVNAAGKAAQIAGAVAAVTAAIGGRVEAAAQQGGAEAGSGLDRLLKLRTEAQNE